MELFLGVLLAAAIVLAAAGWAGRGDALARERRLVEEIAGMRRALQAPPPLSVSADLPPLFAARDDSEPFRPESPFPGIDSAAPAGTDPDIPPSLRPELVAALQRHIETLRKAEESVSAETSYQPVGLPPVLSAPPDGTNLFPARLAAPLLEVAGVLERLLDESARLRTNLQDAGTAAARAHDFVRSATPMARDVERQTEALAPLTATLSGLADRMNLLSLNISLIASAAGEGSAPLQEAGAEIRSLFEEVRELSRNLGTRLRVAVEAAHRSEETFSQAVEKTDAARQRAGRAEKQGEKHTPIGKALEAALALLRTASDHTRVDGETLGRALDSAEARLAAERATSGALLRDASRKSEKLDRLREVLSEERRKAEELLDRLRPPRI